MIEAGILLNCVVCGMVFQPVDVAKKADQAEAKAVAEEKPDVMRAEQSKMAVRSASLELLQTLAETSQDVGRRRHFSESQKSSASCTSSTHLVSPMAWNDSFYYKSMDRIPQSRAECDEYDRSMASQEESSDTSLPAKMYQTVAELLDFRLLLDLVFVLFVFSNLLASVGFSAACVFLPNRGLRLGFDQYESTLLLSAIGISNTVGRVTFGFIGDMKCVDPLVICNTVRVVCGICSVFSVFVLTFQFLLCFSFSFGFLIGT